MTPRNENLRDPRKPDDTPALWRQWSDAAADPALDAELRAIYDGITEEVARRSPTCWISGRCCKFDTYGHRLYVTGLEIAWLLQRLPPESRQRLADADLPAVDACPFQVKKMCSVRDLRPLGCRLFYCDPTAESWSHEVYEQFLAQLRELHNRRALPYRYMEWRAVPEAARDR